MRATLVLWFFLIAITDLQNGSARRPYMEHPNCPIKPDLLTNRKCPGKKCLRNEDCKSRIKKCLCDTACGTRCINSKLKCPDLTHPVNGTVEILPFNMFSAKARYRCDDGYTLAGGPTGGTAERVCQGDRKWSGEAPTCQREGRCEDPPEVMHASHDGALGQRIFPLGTQLTYTCTTGYIIQGFFKAMCASERNWVGPQFSCLAIRCQPPKDIPHGTRIGVEFSYPHRIMYKCMEGFEMDGDPHLVCTEEGRWSGAAPTCRPVRCPRLPAPLHGNVKQMGQLNYGAVVTFSCNTGYKLVGSHERQCLQDGRWSGTSSSCNIVDCGRPKNFWNGYIPDIKATTYGSSINFICHGRAKFQGDAASAMCQANGQWSVEVPTCWGKCRVPFIANGKPSGVMVGDLVEHGKVISMECNEGYSLNRTTNQGTCYNGTWSNLPACKPADCEGRPPDVQNGIVRFHRKSHGARAKYRCNTGFASEGQMFVQCVNGNWKGQAPMCHAVHCLYPGTIDHGEVMLVGVVGKFEYRPYVRGIGHNEQIEYHCNKGYKILGPEAATCVNGTWSPKEKPTCVLGQHPLLTYLYRG